MKKRYYLLILLVVVSISLAACSKEEKVVEVDGGYTVMTTTTLVGDLVKHISGGHVNVQSLMGPGIDPHMYKASAGDVGYLNNADMIIYNGLNLEGKMGEVFKNLEKQGKLTLAVSEDIDESKLRDFETNPGHFDPHIWFDVSLWKEAAKTVNRGLKELAPEFSEDFDKNLDEYLLELDELDEYIKNRASELEEDERILVTAHDAFGYFGDAYGFKVRGLQGVSTSSEAGTSDVRELADYIVENQIKAIFLESSVPSKSIEALQESVKSKGFNVEIGGELYSDSTGDIGTDAETYIGTFKANIDTIVDALK